MSRPGGRPWIGVDGLAATAEVGVGLVWGGLVVVGSGNGIVE